MHARGIGAVLVAAALCGCATLEKTRRDDDALPAPLEQAWPMAVRLLEERGFYVEHANNGQTVVTRWREDFAGSKIAVRWTRYAVIGEDVYQGRSRIRFFRHEGTNQDVLPTNNGLASEHAGIEGQKQAQRNSALGTTSRRFQARVRADPEEERTFQAKPASITVSRDDALELELLARLRGAPVDGSVRELNESARPSTSSEALLDELSEQLCAPNVPGWSDVLAARTTILFGEIPGTLEVPRLISDVACDALVRGHPVVLAVEIPFEEQSRIDAFLASDGSADARARLFEGFFWNRPLQDGRSSQAMLHLLDDARLLRSSGYPLRVQAIDVPGLTGAARSVAMAEGLLSAREDAPAAIIVALVGNLHVAARTPSAPATTADVLLARGEPFISLTLAYSRGTAWTCEQRDRLECGPKSFAAEPAHFRAWHWATPPGQAFHVRSPSIRRWSSREDGLDGTYYVDELTASPPASTL